MKKEKVLIFKGLPPVLVADGKYYATQKHKGEWWVGDELTSDCIRGGKLIREIKL